MAKEHYGKNGYPNISCENMGGCVLGCITCCLGCTHMGKLMKTALHNSIVVDNEPTRRILGIRFERPFK